MLSRAAAAIPKWRRWRWWTKQLKRSFAGLVVFSKVEYRQSVNRHDRPAFFF
jgi:hypothetical protein